jgi:hypothetical protein
MLEHLSKNSEWLFSGLGVVILSFVGRDIWQRFGPKNPPAPPSTPISVTVQLSSPAIEEKAYRPVTLERALLIRRVKVGDYIDLIRDKDRKIRITVNSIETIDSTKQYKNEAETVAAVSLHVNFGGSIAFAGKNVKENGVNEFTIPQHTSHESDDSIYQFHNTEDYSSFFRLYAEHINPRTEEVDLNILHIVGLVRAGRLG